MFEYETPGGDASRDGLYLERLDAFMEKYLAEIRAFAQRESRPYEETKRHVAQWHAKYLFQPPVSLPTTTQSNDLPNRPAQVRSILSDTSVILESLSATSGVQAFILAVDPNEASDGGFLGGSVIGREFWRGLRGGGEQGAKAFKAHATAHLQKPATDPAAVQPPTIERQTSTPPPKAGPAKSLKTEVYESVRNALRVACGLRSAEMKWTNHEKLDIYGVRLVGWPESVPMQNPSTLKANQNRLVLDAIQSGVMRFERTMAHSIIAAGISSSSSQVDGDDANEDFSWAYDADARPSAPLREQSVWTTAPPATDGCALGAGPSPAAPNHGSQSENNTRDLAPTTAVAVDPALSSYSINYPWGVLNQEVEDNDSEIGKSGELDSELERPRKRPRSEEPRP
ncbi:hypothetical protein GALMADRAFT_67652 [Galerina marginata CBS 339.88]|uniref:Uncharacterized protein n=1 Tax=Galerina marginata (strain CBS 339.88) TaxID=685588 RepID=A0A067SZD5_GALM3|nr:hypothetical protein GALMADRAFT_67652 [Galerina marginata CBS 339.88]